MTIRARIAGWLLASTLRLQALTWRKRLDGVEKIGSLLAAGQRILVVFWHGKYVPLFVLLQVPGACVFTSRSFRGDVISETCRRFGFRAVEIPARGGDASLELMRAAIAGAVAAAVAVDGPLGPAHVVKRGAVELASKMGWIVLPVSVASRRKRIRTDRWDRMEVPRAFTRIALAVGDPIEVPPGLDGAGVQAWSARIGEALEALGRRLEAEVQQWDGKLQREK